MSQENQKQENPVESIHNYSLIVAEVLIDEPEGTRNFRVQLLNRDENNYFNGARLDFIQNQAARQALDQIAKTENMDTDALQKMNIRDVLILSICNLGRMTESQWLEKEEPAEAGD